MISERAKHALAEAFQRCARSQLIRDPGDLCTIHPAAPGGGLRAPDDFCIVVTISSFIFRLMTVFTLSETAAMRAYYANNPASGTVKEAFSEIANLCCGALSQELATHFSHLAMSIPNLLNAHSLEYLEELRAQYTRHYNITINDSVNLGVIVCMCCNAPVDFVLTSSAIERTTGELETF